MANDISNTLNALSSLQEQPLSIIRLSEPFSAPQSSTRTSDASNSAFDNPSPASLEADLAHYKELFSKLRFSYLEQVTKEKFLRAIVGDPPLIVEHQENNELESQLAEVKSVLKEQKEHVAQMVKDLEERGRVLTRRYEAVQMETTQLKSLPPQIASLNETITTLRDTLQQPSSSSTAPPNLALPLDATLSLISERQSEIAALDQQIESLQQALDPQTRALKEAQSELKVLEEQAEVAVRAAGEASRRREDGNEGLNELEMRGRWLQGVDYSLRSMLDVDAVA